MWVKICGLTEPEDVASAVEAGADAVGFVFEPSSPRYVGDSTDLHLAVPAGVERVAVFGRVRNVDLNGFTAVQFVEGDAPEGLRIYKAVRSFDAPGLVADALLLDAPDEAKWGGTGKRVDWERAAEFVRSTDAKVILAGGLTPENVKAAIRIVHSWGVDVSSGVESSPGIKSHAKVRAFIEAAKSAG